jgi:hypothetical protein
MNQPPIFIVGSPRSGTSLMRTILNRHPDLAICNETHFLQLVYQARRRRAFGDLKDANARRRLVEEYVATQRMRRLGMDSTVLTERLLHEGISYRALFACLLDCYAQSKGKRRCGEKTPQHARISETLCEWFPGAIILHMLRDPRAAVASLQQEPWASRSAVTNARNWLACNLGARRSSHRSEYLEVRYETLVTQPEAEVARICSFLGEEYFSSMLIPNDVPPPGFPVERIYTPITAERIGTWREELTAEQVAQVEWVVGDHLQTFGYPREAPLASRLSIVRGLSVAAADFVRRGIGARPAGWYYYLRPAELVKQERWRRRYHWRDEPADPPPPALTRTASGR